MVERPTRFVDIFRASFLLPMTVSIALTSIIWAIMLDPTLGPVNGFLRWAGLPAQRFFRSSDQALGTLIVEKRGQARLSLEPIPIPKVFDPDLFFPVGTPRTAGTPLRGP